MSGLCGMVLHRGPSDGPDERIRAMVGALDARTVEPTYHPSSHGKETYCDDRAALGASGGPSAGGHILATGKKGTREVVAFHGRLYASVNGVSPAAEPAVLLPEILDGYRSSGLRFLAGLRGDFLLAFWDEGSRSFALATDPFRVHSVVYSFQRGTLIFASRMASLLAAGDHVPRTINRVAVADIVTSSIVASPATILSAVRKLPPGSRLHVTPSGPVIETYSDIDFRRPASSSRNEMADAVRRSLQASTAARYDVDRSSGVVGTFLSGGVDSTAVTGLLQRISPERVRSFSIGFAETGFNEMSYARVAARALGVEHHEYFVTADDAMAALPPVLESFDEPFANASAIPTFHCARLAREHGVTILYAGDGGDELFAGNERYAARRAFDHYERIPRWARERVLRPAVLAAARALPLPPLRKARRYIERASLPYPERITSSGLLTWLPRETLFEQSFLDAIGADYDPAHSFHDYYRDALASEILDREMYVDLKLVIADNDLLKVTRMTEAAGVGVRFPFLDATVAEVATAIPAALRMERGVLRSFFKDAYADLLPAEIRAKKKHGFGLPIALWLQSHPPLRNLMMDTLLGSRFEARGFLRRSGVEILLRRQSEDVTAFYGTILWNLIVLELWLERHGL